MKRTVPPALAILFALAVAPARVLADAAGAPLATPDATPEALAEVDVTEHYDNGVGTSDARGPVGAAAGDGPGHLHVAIGVQAPLPRS